MNDGKLLVLSAKAAGIDILDGLQHDVSKIQLHTSVGPWNPLKDDSDALRLAVNLKLEIFTGQGPNGDITTVCAPQELDLESCGERHGTDAAAATRRAIVRVAAEIGKGK